jgi:uncharacterized protein YdeI (YjbR/CyaY-like superfamily)
VAHVAGAASHSVRWVWLVSYRKATGKARFDYDETVEEAPCFGWIDSKPNKLDDERAMLWFAPRKVGMGWSRLNKARAEKMIAAGQMTPASLAKIEAAKQDGSWGALDAIEELTIPLDSDLALNANPIAAEYFQAFPRSVKRAILEWIATAKETGNTSQTCRRNSAPRGVKRAGESITAMMFGRVMR